MRKFAVVFIFVLFAGVLAVAQLPSKPFDVPTSELAVTFGYEHASLNGSAANTDGYISDDSTGMKGFVVEYSHYYAHNIGFTLDGAREWNSRLDPAGDRLVRWSGLGGPSYRLHRYGFFLPSVHALAGVDHGTFKVPNSAPSGSTLSFTNSDFAVLAGGTVDGNLSKHVGIRLAQIDYLFTHHYGDGQSGFRYSGGLVLRF